MTASCGGVLQELALGSKEEVAEAAASIIDGTFKSRQSDIVDTEVSLRPILYPAMPPT